MKGRLEPGMQGVWLAAGWLAGAALQLRQPALWPALAYVGLAAAALPILLGGRRFALAALLAGLLLGFGSTGWRAGAKLAEALPAALEGQDLVVTGVVAQMPRTGTSGTRFNLEVESATWQGRAARVPSLITLGWYRDRDADAWLESPAQELRAGQRWRLTVRLKQPHGAMNPGGFDLELWLFEQGIRAGGYVRSVPGASNLKLAEAVAHPFERARQAVRDAITARVADPATAGVLAALAIGDQAAIERDDWDLFRATGVAHLMSISGLHITMFAWLAGAALAGAWRHSRRLMLWLPAPLAGRWGGLACAFAYSMLAGWGVPAQRTVAMIAVVVALRTLGLRWPLAVVLLAAGVVVTVLDPWALLQAGFWLSFMAVALLIASEPVQKPVGPAPQGWRAHLLAALRGGLRSQLIATIGLAPLSMVFFQQISVVGFAANLVAIPVVTLVVTPLALLGVLMPPLWMLAAWVAQGLMAYLGALGHVSWAVWTAAAAPPWAVAAGLLGALLSVLPLPWKLRGLALPLMLPLLFPPVPRPATGQFEAVAADIGQGTAVLVRTAGHLLVYDTGPQYSLEADAGQRVLLPLLRARGERRVDLLVLSHRDSDHVGGAASLIGGMPVAALSSSLTEDHPLRARGLPHRRCEAGQSWEWDGVRFEMLHPTPAEHEAATKPNAVSCVLRVVGGQTSLLLTGDIESPQEAALLARAADVHADVLLVPHHGSRTSSSPAFIEAVSPHLAVVQAAYRSRFHHPAPDIVERYTARGIEVVRSDACGAWTMPALAQGPGLCERQVSRRYWHHAVPPVVD